MDILERQLAYVDRGDGYLEIGTRHDPPCQQPHDWPQPDPAIQERSLVAVEHACNAATLAMEATRPWWRRASWVLARVKAVPRKLRRRWADTLPYRFKDPITHDTSSTSCKWLCRISVPLAADVTAGAIAAERYLYDRGYQIVAPF